MTKNDIIEFWYKDKNFNERLAHYNKRYNYLIGNANLLDDIKQDVFMHMLNMPDAVITDLNNRGKFAAYFFTIAYYYVVLKAKDARDGRYYTSKFYKKYCSDLFCQSKFEEGWNFDYLQHDESQVMAETDRIALIRTIVDEVLQLDYYDRECILLYAKHGNVNLVARDVSTHYKKVTASLKKTRGEITQRLIKKGLLAKPIEFKSIPPIKRMLYSE